MSRWRVVVMILLIAAPLFVLAGVGSFYLWREGWSFYAWWPLTACMTLGYLLGLYWQRRNQLVFPADFTPNLHWTERDRQAWQLVIARAQAANRIPAAKLGELPFYLETAREMAVELARFYHPNASDPVGGLTLPEILAVVELAAHDLAELANQYIPAGHLLTVDHWRQARKVADWYQTGSRATWLVSALFSPLNTGLRYAASQVGMARPWQLLQQDLIAWFYTAYVHRLGNYLIELNSGRLRVGAARYRELLHAEKGSAGEASRPAAAPTPADVEAEPVRTITLVLFGQAKAGKSSFINALLGEQRACTDVLPATHDRRRYELQPPGIPVKLVLIDTPGYGSDSTETAEKAVEDAARHADLLLLVVHALQPARQADVDLLGKVRQWYAARPELRMPPILAILSHIDLLSPAMEWTPPYNWREPTRPKEVSIQEAWTAVREQLGDHLVGIVPVCTAPGKVYGIEEWFFPTLVELLDEARAVALLRCLRAEADAGKVRRTVQQLVEAGKEAAKLILQHYRK